MCCASRFYTGGRGAGGGRSKNLLEGPWRKCQFGGTIWGSWLRLGAGAPGACRTAKPGQSAEAESTQGVFPRLLRKRRCIQYRIGALKCPTKRFLHTPAPVLDRTSEPMGAQCLSSTLLGWVWHPHRASTCPPTTSAAHPPPSSHFSCPPSHPSLTPSESARWCRERGFIPRSWRRRFNLGIFLLSSFSSIIIRKACSKKKHQQGRGLLPHHHASFFWARDEFRGKKPKISTHQQQPKGNCKVCPPLPDWSAIYARCFYSKPRIHSVADPFFPLTSFTASKQFALRGGQGCLT